MKPKPIITIVVVAVIALGALAGVIYGVTTHTEVTFDENAAPWPDGPPLGVSCYGYTPELSSRCDVVEQAFDAFNTRVGFELFEWGAERPVIFFMVGVPQRVEDDPTGNGQDDEGNLYHMGENTVLESRGGQATRCYIRSSNTGDDSVLWVVAYHGAGHYVGLGHDPADYSISVMREIQPDQLEPYSPGSLPSLTDSDRAAVRARYR